MTRTGLLGIACLLVTIGVAIAQPVTYDQRQEGKLNVQVDVKDLQIVALVDSDFLGDYSYDYPLYDDADFTIKPSTKRTTTTPSPTSTTNEPTVEVSSHGVSLSESSGSTVIVDSTTPKTNVTQEPLVKNTTLITTESTEKISEITTTKISESTSNVSENTTKSEDVSSTTENIELTTGSTGSSSSSSTRRPLGTAEPRKRCPMGFQMRSGRCFKRRHSLISPRLVLRQLAPALLGKSQLFGKYWTADSS